MFRRKVIQKVSAGGVIWMGRKEHSCITPREVSRSVVRSGYFEGASHVRSDCSSSVFLRRREDESPPSKSALVPKHV